MGSRTSRAVFAIQIVSFGLIQLQTVASFASNWKGSFRLGEKSTSPDVMGVVVELCHGDEVVNGAA